MINILILEGGTGHGGSSSYLYGFLKYLDKKQFCPFVVLYNYAVGPNVDKIYKLGINMLFLSKKKVERKTIKSWYENAPRFLRDMLYLSELFINNFYRIYKIIIIIKHNKIKAVLLNAEVHYHISGVIAAKLTNTPCVVRKSGVGTDTSSRMRRILSRLVDVFISSSVAETNFHKENKWPSKELVTIYEGVDLEYFKPLPKLYKIYKEFGIPLDSSLIGYISRLEIGKGHDDFIRAAQIVIKNFPSAYFLIVGDDVDVEDGSMKSELKDLTRRLNIEENFIFTGWRTDIKDILQDIDIFVHCPNFWKEGMGIATLEAIASGKPVVISKNWGLAETVKDSFNGFVAPVGNYEMIAKRIIELLLNQNLRKRMGFNSRLYAEENFNIEKNVKKIEQIFHSLLNRSF